jgi:hypothetical protein
MSISCDLSLLQRSQPELGLEALFKRVFHFVIRNAIKYKPLSIVTAIMKTVYLTGRVWVI